MPRPTIVFRSAPLLLAVCLTLPGLSRQAPSLSRGQSVYVVAARDVHALMRCLASSKVPARPSPSTARELVPPWAEPFPGAPDARMRDYAEQVIRQQGRFRIAPSAEAADLVFILDAIYRAPFEVRLKGWSAFDQGTLVVADWTDWPAYALTQLVAVAVPAVVYRQDPTDLSAISSARLWDGIASSASGVLDSPEGLVKAFAAGRGRTYRDGPTISRGQESVCAVPQPARAGWLEFPEPDRSQETRVIVVPFAAADAKGRYLDDLTMGEIRLSDGDLERRPDGVIPSSEPLTLAVILDSSPSVRSQSAAIRDAALALADALNPLDRMLVASFNSRIYVECEATSSRDELRRIIGQARPGGSTTRLYDALDAIAGERITRLPGRRAAVLITDGIDTGSAWAGEAAAIDQAASSGVPTYIVQLDEPAASGLRFAEGLPKGAEVIRAPEGYLHPAEKTEQATRFLQRLSTATLGRVERARGDQVKSAVLRVADELRHQVLLYYLAGDSPRSAPSKDLRVSVDRPGVTVTTRPAWRARLRQARAGATGPWPRASVSAPRASSPRR